MNRIEVSLVEAARLGRRGFRLAAPRVAPWLVGALAIAGCSAKAEGTAADAGAVSPVGDGGTGAQEADAAADASGAATLDAGGDGSSAEGGVLGEAELTYVAPAKGLQVDVTTSVSEVAPGGRILYEIRVGNVSSKAVDGVKVFLRVPAGIQFNSAGDSEPNGDCYYSTCAKDSETTWTIGSIPPGGSQLVVLNAQVLASVGEGDTIVSAFDISATNVDRQTVSKPVRVHGSSQSQVVLGSPVASVTVGQTYSLDIDVGAAGTSALASAELRLDLAPGLALVGIGDGGASSTRGVVMWSLGNVAVGASLHRKVDVMAVASVPPGALLASRATLRFNGAPSEGSSAEYSNAVLPASLPLTLELHAIRNPVVPSGRLVYEATVSNPSPRAVDEVVLSWRTPSGLSFNSGSDSLPSGNCYYSTCNADGETTWSLGTVAAGTSRTVRVNASVLPADLGDGSLVRGRVQMAAKGLTRQQAVDTVQVFSRPDATLTVGAIHNPVLAGEVFRIDLDVGQISAAAVGGAQIAMTLPPGLTADALTDGASQAASGEVKWAIGAIPVGASVHRALSVKAASSVPAGTFLSARAALTYDGGNAIDVLAERGVTVVAGAPPLGLAVTTAPTAALPGSRLLYTTTLTNSSLRAVDDVNVVVRVPAGLTFGSGADSDPDADCYYATCAAHANTLWKLGSIPAGGTRTITVNANVLPEVATGSIITWSTYVSGTGLSQPIEGDTSVAAGAKQ